MVKGTDPHTQTPASRRQDYGVTALRNPRKTTPSIYRLRHGGPERLGNAYGEPACKPISSDLNATRHHH